MLGLVRHVLGKPSGDLLAWTGERYGGWNNIIRPTSEIARDSRTPRERLWITPVALTGHADRLPGVEKGLDHNLKCDHAVPHIGILRREARHTRLALQRADQNRRHPDLGVREEFRILHPVQFPRIGKLLTLKEG